MTARDAIQARREQVAALTLGRRSQMEIAKALGVGRTTIHKDVVALRKEWREKRFAQTDEAAGEELARLEAIERVLWPLIMRADMAAIDRWLKLAVRRARLLGFDEPIKVDITDRLRKLAEAEGLDADELIRIAESLILADG